MLLIYLIYNSNLEGGDDESEVLVKCKNLEKGKKRPFSIRRGKGSE